MNKPKIFMLRMYYRVSAVPGNCTKDERYLWIDAHAYAAKLNNANKEWRDKQYHLISKRNDTNRKVTADCIEIAKFHGLA